MKEEKLLSIILSIFYLTVLSSNFFMVAGTVKAQTGFNELTSEESAIDCNAHIYVSNKDEGFFGKLGGIWSSDAGMVCKISTTFNEFKIHFCALIEGKSKKECMEGMGVIDKLTGKAAQLVNSMK